MERQKRSWLTRRDKVELFEQIRRELEFGVGTIAGVSRKLCGKADISAYLVRYICPLVHNWEEKWIS